MSILKLAQFQNGTMGDVFLLFVSREQMLTSTKKNYWRVAFRDETREVSFPIWENSPQFEACRNWTPGKFYKIRGTFHLSKFGPQLEIHQIRETTDADREQGFQPNLALPATSFDPNEMFAEIDAILADYVTCPGLLKLVRSLFEKYREPLLTASAAQGKHHAMAGGLLEHTRNVLRNVVWLADRYAALFPAMNPPLDKGLAAAGAALHDFGKLRELRETPVGFEYTPEGNLLGHIVMGRDYVRDMVTTLHAADPEFTLDFETQLRLEHIILSHQRLPEWGSPKTNMTPESLLVHYADDLDAKFCIMANALASVPEGEEFSDNRNALRQMVFKGIQK
ncbi:MAG: HD domain-containing protein [Planctomycetia bacterium]|nr:HD domain-containing protein [Planctomycetia bacterium]